MHWNKLAKLKTNNKISEKPWWYLNNYEMPRPTKTKTGSEVFDHHLYSCNKAAVIGLEMPFIGIYAIFKEIVPKYLGEDTINENLEGYTYWGYFPDQILLVPKFYFQSGINDWWQMHIRWYFKYKIEKMEWATKSSSLKHKFLVRSNEFYGGTQIYSLCLVTSIGHVISAVTFIFFEIKAYKRGYNFFRKQFKYVFNLININFTSNLNLLTNKMWGKSVIIIVKPQS